MHLLNVGFLALCHHLNTRCAPGVAGGVAGGIALAAAGNVRQRCGAHLVVRELDELARLRAENDELKAAVKRLSGENEDCEDGTVAIATYRFEQRIRIPDDAVGWEIKWGELRCVNAANEEYSLPPYSGPDFHESDYEIAAYLKRPDAVRVTDEDEDEASETEDEE